MAPLFSYIEGLKIREICKEARMAIVRFIANGSGNSTACMDETYASAKEAVLAIRNREGYRPGPSIFCEVHKRRIRTAVKG